MGALVLGALALLLALVLLRWFVGADPKALMKGLRYFGAALLVLAAVGLAFVDRPALAIGYRTPGGATGANQENDWREAARENPGLDHGWGS